MDLYGISASFLKCQLRTVNNCYRELGERSGVFAFFIMAPVNYARVCWTTLARLETATLAISGLSCTLRAGVVVGVELR